RRAAVAAADAASRRRAAGRAHARVRRCGAGAPAAAPGRTLRSRLAAAVRRGVRRRGRGAGGQRRRRRPAPRARCRPRLRGGRRRVRDRGVARRGAARGTGCLPRRRGYPARRRRAPGRARGAPARGGRGAHREGAVRSGLRALRIGRVLLRYRLDDLLSGTPAERWLRLARPFVPRASREVAAMPRGERLRLALQELGPIFVKFGQILSTRRDLLPADVADELTLLQDRVAPFPGDVARAIVERELEQPVVDVFASFDTTPLASASIAPVHAATLPARDGAAPREVVVKVLRPGIEAQVDQDIALLRRVAALVDRTHPRADRIRPRDVVAEIESTLAAELDLQREGANASVLRRNWLGSNDLYVPEPIWTHTTDRVLTLERVHGIPSDDIAALDAAGIDRKALAAKGVRVFYTQVFRDNFFHADAHAGNIWVDTDPARKADPRFIALDFGIMGQLSSEDQYYLAENFMAIFNKDYRRIAELHVQAGWMPSHIRIDELEAAARAVCEPYFTRPLSEISLGEVLLKLFRTAQRYELTIQ